MDTGEWEDEEAEGPDMGDVDFRWDSLKISISTSSNDDIVRILVRFLKLMEAIFLSYLRYLSVLWLPKILFIVVNI